MADGSQELMRGEKIAYFSMEIGLMKDMPTYSGGLGILAGDTLKSGADLGLPLVAVTIVSRKGYLRQELDSSGKQIAHPDEWDPSRLLTLLPQRVTVRIGERDVNVRAWLYRLRSPVGGEVPIIFLDTDTEENVPQDREITHYLYGGDERYRLKQEIILGLCGVRMLDALGFKIRKYHMNEGHSSLLSLELLHRLGTNVEAVKEKCIFTTHTPVDAAHDKFPYPLVEELIKDESDVKLLKKFGGSDMLNMTLLALNLSNYVNGVAKRHGETGTAMFPGYKIHAITNGVHSYTWTCPCFRKVYDRYIPGWANEPEKLVRVGGVPDEDIWVMHMEAKRTLIDYVNRETGKGMDYETLTLGFARRATPYKRLGLIFSDLERLRRANSRGRIQIVLAGKAHPRDEGGKKEIEEIFKYIQVLDDEIKVAYLQDYDIELAAKMVSGVDVWLNTPLPPYEASGTSGMKAAHNGVVNFSVLDGWWIEGWIEGVTGWSIGPEPWEKISYEEARAREKDDLYSKLMYIIIPMFYHMRDAWIGMMNNSIGMVAYYFNSHRMMRRYVTEAYL
ncbi:MAG: alpha-glucan family phosphorylase [Methanotrichaceae archaeon]|nr:alpha-glucan family phosphorylase [Methanotrichaceae archaeon]